MNSFNSDPDTPFDPMDATPVNDREWVPAARRSAVRRISAFFLAVFALFICYQLLAGRENGLPLACQPELMLAEYHYNNGKYNEAIANFREIEKMSPAWKENGDYWIAMAQGHLWTQAHTMPTTKMVRDIDDTTYDNIAQRTRDLLLAKNYSGLEALHGNLLQSRKTFVSGRWGVGALYNALSDAPDAHRAGTKPAVESAIKQAQLARNWALASPCSVLARVALADSFINIAWAARGNGNGNTISPAIAKYFDSNLTKALRVLESARGERDSCPGWFLGEQQVELGLGAPKSEYIDLLKDAESTFPGFFDSDSSAVVYLLPRWYGKSGDCAKFVTTRADAIGGVAGDILYARLANTLRKYSLSEAGLSWPRIDRGFKALMKQNPRSVWAPSAYCATAGDMQQFALIQKLYKTRLATQADIGVWRTRQHFESTRAWAFGAGA